MYPFTGYGSIGQTTTNPVTPLTPSLRRILVRPTRRQNVTLLRALHSCFALQFYSIGLLKFVSDTAGFAGPMLLNRMVLFVEDDTIDLHIGLVNIISTGKFGLPTCLWNA